MPRFWHSITEFYGIFTITHISLPSHIRVILTTATPFSFHQEKSCPVKKYKLYIGGCGKLHIINWSCCCNDFLGNRQRNYKWRSPVALWPGLDVRSDPRRIFCVVCGYSLSCFPQGGVCKKRPEAVDILPWHVVRCCRLCRNTIFTGDICPADAALKLSC